MDNPDEPFDAGDGRAVGKLIKAAKSAHDQRTETLRWIMHRMDGRKWIYETLILCHCYHNPYSKDPIAMAFNCGELNIGQQILVQVENADPSLYLLMLRENNEAQGQLISKPPERRV